MVGSVGGLVDGHGAFGQRPGLLLLAQVLQDGGEVGQADGDVGVVGSVGGLGDGQGAFGQRPGLLVLAQVLQDEGEVVQVGGDVGVVGSVGGLGDGHGAFGQRPGFGEPGMDLQVGGGAVQQPGSVCPGRALLLAREAGEMTGGSQDVRQQHRPPGPVLRCAHDRARRISPQQPQRRLEPAAARRPRRPSGGHGSPPEDEESRTRMTACTSRCSCSPAGVRLASE